MTQQEIEIGEMVNTPVGRMSMVTIVFALQQMHDPKTTIAIKWDIDDVKSRREALTDEQCMDVLNECKDSHDAEYGMNWDTIDHWIYTLYGSEK